jgi:hypothetical protein
VSLKQDGFFDEGHVVRPSGCNGHLVDPSGSEFRSYSRAGTARARDGFSVKKSMIFGCGR